MRSLLVVIALCLATPAWANHQEFAWDANIEADMQEYRIYVCVVDPVLVCTLAQGTLLGTVLHPTTNLVVSHGTEGEAFATAVDTSGNESTESNVVTYDAKPPFGPKNFKFQRK